MKPLSEIFSINLRNCLYMAGMTQAELARKRKIAELSRTEKPREIKFTESWKQTYERLDTEHRRSFWRSIIKGVELDKDAQPIRILY